MQRLYPCPFPHTLHLWPRKETARSRGSGQTPLRPSRSPVLGTRTASAHLQPIPTTRPPLGRRVHLLAAVRGLDDCTKASAGHPAVSIRVLVSLPRMGQLQPRIRRRTPPSAVHSLLRRPSSALHQRKEADRGSETYGNIIQQ